MEAGTALFLERGINVQVSEITQRAGLAKGTFFRHFPTKAALVDTILDENLEAVAALSERYAQELPDNVVRRFAEAAAELIVPRRAILEHAILARQLGGPPEPTATELMGNIEVMREHGVARGEIRDDISAWDIFVSVMSATAGVYRPESQHNPDAWRRGLALALDGLKCEAAGEPLPAGAPIDLAHVTSLTRPT